MFWGRVATGGIEPGQQVKVLPSGQTATVAQVLNHVRQPEERSCRATAPASCWTAKSTFRAATGCWRPARLEPSREISATIAWMDDEPLVAGRVYWALHGHRWVKAKVKRIVHKLDINTLAEADADHLEPNSIGHVDLALQEPLAALPYHALAYPGLAGAGGHGQPQDLRGCAG